MHNMMRGTQANLNKYSAAIKFVQMKALTKVLESLIVYHVILIALTFCSLPPLCLCSHCFSTI